MTKAAKLITDNLDIWASAVKTKSSAGRGSSKKIELYGVKKLRGLVLDLAMRGLLVPHDPDEKPASVLLKEIFNKRSSSNLIKEEEKPYALPKGWEWIRFGDIAQHNAGKTLDRGRNSGKPRDYLTTSNLYWGEFDLSSVKQMLIEDDELASCTARKGDLLICEGGEAGRAAVWDLDREICFQNHVHRARFYDGISPYYAYRFFEKLSATGEIEQYRKGVGISNMSGKALASIVVPLAPTNTQLRIVTKVNELMSLCDQLEQQQENSMAAHETLVETMLAALTSASEKGEFDSAWARISEHFHTLFTTEGRIEQLKQAILQLAVMGKLVRQDPRDEPAGELLKQVKAKKEILIKEGKIKRGGSPPTGKKNEKPFELPNGWEIVPLNDLLPEFQNGASSRGDKDGKEIVVIRLADISDWKVSLKETRRLVMHNSSIQKYSLSRGDILIIRVNGSSDIVGRFISCEEDLNAIYCDHFIRLRFPVNVVSSLYLSLVASSTLVRKRIEELFVSTAGQKTVNQKHIGSLLIMLPPMAEQFRIIDKTNELIALCDRLKARIIKIQLTQLQLSDATTEQMMRTEYKFHLAA